MSQERKRKDSREKDLQMAMMRIERGRAHTKATKLSISSVAREAQVSAALIHNYYPAIAEAIRDAQGRSSREQRDAKHDELKAAREKNRELRLALEAALAQRDQLASINEVLLEEGRDRKSVV